MRSEVTTDRVMRYLCMDSPIGPLLLTSDGSSLTGVYMDGHHGGGSIGAGWVMDDSTPPLIAARQQLEAYFRGELTEFDLKLEPSGTDFQRRVWRELRAIGYGETLSYGELARRLGDPNASRAVGLANGRNPLSIVVPCHRVIGANGKLVGYGGGLGRKAILLDFEKAVRSLGPHDLMPAPDSLFAEPV